MPDYSRKEAEEILKRAIAREQRDGVAHDDLLAAAAEVGIDPRAVEVAAVDLERERERHMTGAAALREHRRGFGRRVVSLLFLNAVALAADVMTGPDAWYHWVALGSAVLLGFRAIRAFMPSDGDLRRAERRLRRRERRRERERAAEQRQRSRSSGGRPHEHFERVVEEGVEALLRAAADRIEAYNRQRRRNTPPRVRIDGTARQHDDSDWPQGQQGSDRPRRRRDT